MKATKESVTPKQAALPQSKIRSARPMRSLVAVRSLKPKTHVAGVFVKATESAQN